MTGKLSVLALVPLVSCTNEKSVSPPENQAPTALITRPFVGEDVPNGAFYVASGRVSDPDHGPDELSVRWVMKSEERCGPMPPDSEGNTTCELSFGWDRTSLTLMVVDPEGAEGSTTVEVNVEEAEAPVVAITSPESGAEFRTDELIYFTATVSDGEDRPEGLGLVWESDHQGLLDMNDTITSDGDVEGSIRLDPETHVIRLWATDTSGRTSGDEIVINVFPEAAPPMVSITAPESGAVFAPGELVVLQAEVGDERDEPDTLGVEWASSEDGTLGSAAVDSAGRTTLSTSALSEGNHLLTVTVTDSDEMTSTANIEISIGDSEGDTGS